VFVNVGKCVAGRKKNKNMLILKPLT
jgi:hypothetical protein